MSATAKKTTKKKPAAATKESGVVYLSSTGAYFEAPEITADKLYDFRKNIYAKGRSQKHKNVVFGESYTLEVSDQYGKQAEDIELDMTRMCDMPDVDLWSKIQISDDEVFWNGCGVFNDVWDYDSKGIYSLQKLRHLNSRSFDTAPWDGDGQIYSQLLPGITLNDKKEIEYYQVQDDIGIPTKLENVLMIKDPTSTELAGESVILPLVPIFSMLKFVWDTVMQQTNRTGAKILFLKVTDPQPASALNGNVGDMDAAKEILEHWGKNTAFPLRSNMEIIDPKISDDSSSLEVIEALNQMLIDYSTPIDVLSSGNDSARLGGTDTQRLELVYRRVKYEHSWLERQWKPTLQKYLDYNGFDGYTVNIHIPTPKVDTSEIDIKRAETGIKAKVLFPNELRVLLGHEAKTDEELLDLEEIYKRMQPMAPTFGFASSSAETDTEPENVDEEVMDETTDDIQKAAQRLSKGLVAAMMIEEK